MRVFRRRKDGPPTKVRLLTRPGCHLCEEMLALAGPVAREEGVALEVVDVDSDPALAARWGLEIPVLLDESGRLVAKVRDPEAKIRRRLRGS